MMARHSGYFNKGIQFFPGTHSKYCFFFIGGKEVENEHAGTTWIPNKDGWPMPEGTQEPPNFNPLQQNVSEFCTNEENVNQLHTHIVNRVAIHECNGYCLRKKNVDSKTRYCRAHFGKEDLITRKTPGKDPHPFEPWIVGDSHPRYDGPRDHPKLLMHVKSHLMTWLANCDTQVLIDQDLLNLQKYIVNYACKGAVSTEDLVTIYKHLVNSSDSTISLKNIVHRLLMKIVGMIDVPAAAVDFINSGGKLYHSTRHFRRVGLSGYRPLNKHGNDENLTCETVLDKFLKKERRTDNPSVSLWDWAKECNCKSKCSKDHVPIFTGGPIKPVWPLSEESCKFNLMIFSPGTWEKPEDLKEGFDTYAEAFAAFLDSEDCDSALKEFVQLSKKRYDKKMSEKKSTSNESCENQSQSSGFNSQISEINSQASFSSQDSVVQTNQLGRTLLRDIYNQHQAHFEKVISEEEPLFDGGKDFDWYNYGLWSFGSKWPVTAATWINDMQAETEDQIWQYQESVNLPEINLLYANPLQRVIIALNIQKLLQLKRNENPDDGEPLRLLIQGTAGTGKTFVIKAISYIARRLFRRNGAVMNLAPTGSASNLLPDGRTIHSTLPPLSKSKMKANLSAQMCDYPMGTKNLERLRRLIGYDKNSKTHQLRCLNMDERSMFSHRLLAWSSQRLCEGTGYYDEFFGSVPIVNYFGDLGQLGPIDERDLFFEPGKSCPPDQLAGYTIYKEFKDCIVLDQTMRQGKDEKALLDRLLRIRNGTVTQQDWIDINARYENDLPPEEKKDFEHDQVITLHETWAEVRKENRTKLSKLGNPIAIIPSTGRGRHHQQGYKQVGQIVPKCLLAVGARVLLTKNQGSLTQFGLNNGAIGKVIAILYEPNCGPPAMPIAVICEFQSYHGPAWMEEHPKWVPIVPVVTRCNQNCCSRKGLPLMPGYAIPIAKSQGMNVGNDKPATHMRLKLLSETFMERMSIGMTYTSFSRVENENRWCLVEKIPQDRLMYINNHPQMKFRMEEEQRLKKLSQETIKKYSDLMEDQNYIRILQEFDAVCNDGIYTHQCGNSNDGCNCIACRN